jgi:hypothetical protein
MSRSRASSCPFLGNALGHGTAPNWSLEALKIEFEELILADAPIGISGFSLDEIDQIVLGDGADGLEKGPLEPDPFATPISKFGDIFQLGPHRLACADATDRETLLRVMEEGEVARLVLTDEPYNVPIVGNATKGRHREFAMAAGGRRQSNSIRRRVARHARSQATPYLARARHSANAIEHLCL